MSLTGTGIGVIFLVGVMGLIYLDEFFLIGVAAL